MENQITCPNCKKTIVNDPVIISAAKGENLGSTYVLCECGEKISFWAVTAQLRDQKKIGARLKNWFRNLTKGQA